MMRILILGGAGLTGPHQARYALVRGHDVTLFNRGRTALPADIAPHVEQLHGDRAAGDLHALGGRQWDVCIDVPTSMPSWARDAATALQGRVGHYVFVSTISVYADTSRPLAEDDALAAYEGADAYAETVESLRAAGFASYGALKALCEREVMERFPSAAAIVRPGLIAGPGDATDRVTYWPLRVRRGGEVLAPGSPQDPTQFIDTRDLAEWLIRLAEQRTTGVFNATGPAEPLSFGDFLDRLRTATGSDAHWTWLPFAFLQAQSIAPWSDLPAWVPGDGGMAGLMRADVSRARAAGLTFRPLEDTVRDTLAWFDALPDERRGMLKAGLTPQREAAALAAWSQQRR